MSASSEGFIGPTLTIATNACPGDQGRLRHVVPSWLRVFGQRLTRVVVVVDRHPATGRIARMHGTTGNLQELLAEIERLMAVDARVRRIDLDSASQLDRVSRKWFTWGTPVRCQAGTPLFAFVQAIEEVQEADLVLRCDCDMLFREDGWLAAASTMLSHGRADLIEPPRLGSNLAPGPFPVSSRAFLLSPRRFFASVLPFHPHRLSLARRLHRRLLGRPGWLALEQMLEKERLARRLLHVVLDETMGFSMHVSSREQVAQGNFSEVVARVESGQVPEAQQRAGWDFVPAAWEVPR